MSRLTNKIKDNYYLHTTTTDETDFKLGKLEDIEEELGCPIEVVFKALKNGIYKGHSMYHYNVDFGIYGYEYMFSSGREIVANIKDYKKTWFLKETREE